VITHLLAERPAFLQAVGRVSNIAAVLPKPRSIDEGALREVSSMMQVDHLDRAAFANPDRTVAYLETRAAMQPVVVLDIGGYFAPSLHHACEQFSGEIVGVVEDTENGHQRYLALGKLPCPVFTVARSPLKDPEDYLVGQSVTFSAEALIRSRGDILHERPAAVIGYGKLGRSIAEILHAKHVGVTVYDSDPVRRAQALATAGPATTSTFWPTATPSTSCTGRASVLSSSSCRLRSLLRSPAWPPPATNPPCTSSVPPSGASLRRPGFATLMGRHDRHPRSDHDHR
jgi:adenosylhomocysteinase